MEDDEEDALDHQYECPGRWASNMTLFGGGGTSRTLRLGAIHLILSSVHRFRSILHRIIESKYAQDVSRQSFIMEEPLGLHTHTLQYV